MRQAGKINHSATIFFDRLIPQLYNEQFVPYKLQVYNLKVEVGQ